MIAVDSTRWRWPGSTRRVEVHRRGWSADRLQGAGSRPLSRPRRLTQSKMSGGRYISPCSTGAGVFIAVHIFAGGPQLTVCGHSASGPGMRRIGLPTARGSAAACRAHRICHHRTTRAHRLLGAGRPVPRGLVLHLGIELGAQQDDDCGDPEPGHEADRGAERSVGLVEAEAGARRARDIEVGESLLQVPEL